MIDCMGLDRELWDRRPRFRVGLKVEECKIVSNKISLRYSRRCRVHISDVRQRGAIVSLDDIVECPVAALLAHHVCRRSRAESPRSRAVDIGCVRAD